MKINEQWEELREKSHANIQSERGILKRQTRSIQTEGRVFDTCSTPKSLQAAEMRYFFVKFSQIICCVVLCFVL